MRLKKDAPYHLPRGPRMLRLREVLSMTGVSRPTIYRLMKQGKFPHQRKIGAYIAVWPEHEVLDWIERVTLQDAGSSTKEDGLTATHRPQKCGTQERPTSKFIASH